MANRTNPRNNRRARKRRQQEKLRNRLLMFVAVLIILVVTLVLSNMKPKQAKKENNSSKNVLVTESYNKDNETQSNNTESRDETASYDTKEEVLTTVAPTTKAGEVVGKTSKGYDIVEVDGVTYVNGIMIVNKTYSLPASYNPRSIFPEVQQAFASMQAQASSQGLNIYISSGFRSYDSQVAIYNNYVRQDGQAKADTYSARAGHSEHQSGYCFDLNSIDETFTNTPEGKWVKEHAHEYGFIIRFPEGKQNITGYMYESWHLRYVGVEIATDIYNKGVCLEEYLGVTSEYAN